MPVIALGATSVKEFGSVDKSMKLVQATMGSTDAQAKQLESTMKKAAANSVFGMQDAADATLNFARQGFNAKQAGDMLTPALNLAAGTATDLSVVTGGLGNALKMFGQQQISYRQPRRRPTRLSRIYSTPWQQQDRSAAQSDGQCPIWPQLLISSVMPESVVLKEPRH